MGHLLDDLVGTQPSDRGGAIASNRLAYQKDWTFCLLLKLHSTDSNYVVVCDFHDDVLMLDGGSPPTDGHFYQIKTTSSKRWTVSRLLKREKSEEGKESPSTLGKLYSHRIKFGDSVRSLNFVCNLPFSIELASEPSADARGNFDITEISGDEIKKISAALKAELSLTTDPTLDSVIIFQVSDLHVTDHSAQTRGRLADFLENINSDRAYPIRPLYRVISDEIERRTNHEHPCLNVVDLLKFKGISREDFESFIKLCLHDTDRMDPRRVIDELNHTLTNESVPWIERKRLLDSVRVVAIERLDPARRDLASLHSAAASILSTVMPTHSGGLMLLLQKCTLMLSVSSKNMQHSDDVLKAVIAWEALTYEFSLPTTATQSPQRTP